jgi:hypothetical protein
MPKLSFSVLFLLTFTLCWPTWSQGGSQLTGGLWATEAIDLSYTQEIRRIEMPSPDNGKIAIVENEGLRVMSSGRLLAGTEHEGVYSLAELVWAPDSTAFFITLSDGGIVGTWETRVYLIEKEKVRRVNVTQVVASRFQKQYKCLEPEEPNIAGIKWLDGARKLLLVAEVPPHSSCPEMGKVAGYIVAIPNGKIIQEFGKKKLKADWSQYLGPRLMSKGK